MNNGEIANRYKRKERRKVNEDSIGDNVQATMGGRRNPFLPSLPGRQIALRIGAARV